MTDSSGPIDALNQVLSEVIDVVQTVKQAHRKVPETHALHAELDQLFADLGGWARLLIQEDETLGVSPLAGMPSVAGRTPPNLWPGEASDEDVRRIVGEQLERLGRHVADALAAQGNDSTRSVLDDVERGVRSHQTALSGAD